MRSNPDDAPRRRLDDVARRATPGWTPVRGPAVPSGAARRHAPDAERRAGPDVARPDLLRDPMGDAWASPLGPASAWSGDHADDEPPPALDEDGRRVAGAVGRTRGVGVRGVVGPPPSDGQDAREGWDPGGALARVRDGYVAAHARSPLDDAWPEPGDDRAPHRSGDAPVVRWLLSWRVAAAAAVVVVLTAGTVAMRVSTRATGSAVDIPTPAAATAPAVVDGPGPEPGPSGGPSGHATPVPTGGAVLVHVVGAVVAPGVVRLQDGARVEDALAAAGGAAADADLSTVNLARVVVDGEQVVVLRAGEQAAGGPAPSTAGSAAATGAGVAAGDVVDLNTADATALDALPGIGPVLAQRIVEHRTEHRFGSVDELADVRGIGPALLENLRPLVRV